MLTGTESRDFSMIFTSQNFYFRFRELRLALASKISLGNKLLDLDLVPREEDGRPADPDQQGIAHIFNVVS